MSPEVEGSSGSPPLADIIQWAAMAMDPSLRDGKRIDVCPFVPFIVPGTRWFYWELHLSREQAARVDFLHRPSLLPSAHGSIFAGPDPILPRLVDWYAQPDTARHCHETAWLEIDGPLTHGRQARQSVSICLEPDIGRRARRAPRPRPPTEVVVDIFSRLRLACFLEPRGSDVLAGLHQALDAAGGSVRHLSVMRGREGCPAKVYAALPHGRLSEFLAAIAWPGDSSAALKLADLACAESKAVNVDLSFDDALLPRIAYEHFSDPSPARDPWRRRATSLARCLGLLTKDQAEALERWVGSFCVPFVSNSLETKVVRWFDVKFVATPEGLEFKPYLGFRICCD